ncbi:MAG: DNA repair protein RecN [Burkholderiales bacterium]|nr:DNA repair protein RecN [Burkholderiales bacterium]MDE2276693.1 DNA repair protein RecN [Burkholderiales bacterium]
MLRRLALRDVVIVPRLEIELGRGFTVLTGETGAGKSILIDALQLALGNRADAALVREGAARAEVSAEFDTPASLRPWLDEGGFAVDDTLLLRRTVEAQGDAAGRSRAWINGSPATVAQLREAADHLVEIHGQHAWQSLTRPAAVRALLDAQAGSDTAAMAAAWQVWRLAMAALADARARQDTLERERQRLAWQIAEIDKLAPAEGEWDELEREHQRHAHAQALLDGARAALEAIAEAEANADALCSRAITALDEVQRFDAALGEVAEVLRGAQAQIEDAAHTLHAYLGHREPDPARLAELDARLGAWLALARRYRRAPAALPALRAAWKTELAALDAASDLQALERAAADAERAWRHQAERISRLRRQAAAPLAAAVTQAMQHLGMAGGRFEIALLPLQEPQAGGLETIEFRVAGHAGSTPRALGKVASGGELSRLALAIATATVAPRAPAAAVAAGQTPPTATLIFDEIDAGVGGAVADSVGRLMKQLGGSSQVLAVTHLAQVAACADRHFVVSKALQGRQTLSAIEAVEGEARVAEIARMLGGERLSGTAHAQALLGLHEGQR